LQVKKAVMKNIFSGCKNRRKLDWTAH